MLLVMFSPYTTVPLNITDLTLYQRYGYSQNFKFSFLEVSHIITWQMLRKKA